MKNYAILASAALAALSNTAQAAEWNLNFTGTFVLWYEDAPNYSLTDLHLHIVTEDVLSTSTANWNLGEGYKITSFSGTRNGEAITAVYSAPEGGFYYYGVDPYLYTNDPQILSTSGLGYKTADGTLYSLYGYTATFVDPPQVQWWEQTSHLGLNPYAPVPYVTFGGEMTVTAVPEPTSLALMLGGVVLVGGIARRQLNAAEGGVSRARAASAQARQPAQRRSGRAGSPEPLRQRTAHRMRAHPRSNRE